MSKKRTTGRDDDDDHDRDGDDGGDCIIYLRRMLGTYEREHLRPTSSSPSPKQSNAENHIAIM